MRKATIIMFIVIAVVSCNNREKLIFKDGQAYLNNSEMPFTGVYVDYWEKGELKSEISYNDGIKKGKYIYYFENGSKWYEGSTEDGKESGLWTECYENGQYKEQGIFVKGLKNGFWIKWDSLGNELDKKLFQTYEDSLYDMHFLIHDFVYRNFILGVDSRLPESYLKFRDGKRIYSQFVFHTDYKNSIVKRITKEDRGEYTMVDIVNIKRFSESEGNRLKDSLLSSVYIEYYGDRRFSKIRRIKGLNGERIEKNTYFYPNGQKVLERHYIDFKKDSIWTWWNSEGELEKTVYCENDIIYNSNTKEPLNDTLNYKYYYENSICNTIVPFIEGVENGTLLDYRDSILVSKYDIIDGLYNGQSITYLGNGAKSTIDYVNDTIHGKMITYFPNGDTNLVFDYVKGQKTGEGYYHYEAHGRLGGYFKNENDSVTRVTMLGYHGDVWKTFTKVNDLVEGEYLIRNQPDVGIITHRVNFEKGTKQGKCEHYYNNGKPLAAYNYWYDILDGKFEQYYQNGKIKTEGYWDNGARSGTWRIYEPDGKLSKEGEYADGLLLKGDTINLYYDFEIDLTIF